MRKTKGGVQSLRPKNERGGGGEISRGKSPRPPPPRKDLVRKEEKTMSAYSSREARDASQKGKGEKKLPRDG